DNQTLASGSMDGSIRVWRLNPRSAIPLHTLMGHTKPVWSVAFSPDGQMLASGSVDQTIKLWRMGDGKVSQTLVGHSGAVWSVAFNPNGQTLASGSYDRTSKLWHIVTGKLLGNFVGHTKPVWSVAFSPDGQTLASGSGDETIKLWSVPRDITSQTNTQRLENTLSKNEQADMEKNEVMKYSQRYLTSKPAPSPDEWDSRLHRRSPPPWIKGKSPIF
ncbi:MAG: WD40 repeat domain-containing protein, partial [Leptolyngbyaceae cyanobacterium CAN_BIN12]|nr:WD40 repeat domain-containing protein [Leptolyngbyaceae cyanobacterium CAN_BIN12]